MKRSLTLFFGLALAALTFYIGRVYPEARVYLRVMSVMILSWGLIGFMRDQKGQTGLQMLQAFIRRQAGQNAIEAFFYEWNLLKGLFRFALRPRRTIQALRSSYFYTPALGKLCRRMTIAFFLVFGLLYGGAWSFLQGSWLLLALIGIAILNLFLAELFFGNLYYLAESAVQWDEERLTIRMGAWRKIAVDLSDVLSFERPVPGQSEVKATLLALFQRPNVRIFLKQNRPYQDTYHTRETSVVDCFFLPHDLDRLEAVCRA